MTAPPQPQQQHPTEKWIVKQVVSGDAIVIRKPPKGGPPPEKTVYLSYIIAPKLAKRAMSPDSQDEPFAWEAREFLRKKLVGQAVSFVFEKSLNSRDYGTIFLGPPQSGENINETLLREGLASLRGDQMKSQLPEVQRLIEVQDAAKAAHKGKWGENVNPQEHIRKITWVVDNMSGFVDKKEYKPLKAIIEHVRDGSTVRAFLLPDFVYVTLMMSGIRSPQFKLDQEGKPDPTSKVDFADEARYFTESRLLQQEVEVILESFNGNNFVGSILHPKGSIAEELLKAGLARCVDWSIAKMKKPQIESLRQAEKMAKEKRLRIWKDWTPPPTISDNEFVGTVIEIINGDAMMVKLPNGTTKKIFLASIRPPRPQEGMNENKPPGNKPRPLYDVPWMFEAREFLRKKLIGKKVQVTVDYIQPPRDGMQEKICCTVTSSSVNVAEALVSKGLATVIRYRQNDDQRASAYDSLLAAEVKAAKGLKGIHAKKDIPTHRINDCSGDPVKAKALLAPNMRAPQVEALVEYVTSGSRLRLFLPKDSSLVTFLLSGVDLKGQRDDGVNNEEAALQFTRERCMQREVQIKVEGSDRVGNFTGWLWVEGVNLSVALVEHGLAKVHSSGENSEYAKQFTNAVNTAKSNGLWKFVEVEEHKEVQEEDKSTDRKVDYQEVVVVETIGLSFYIQYASMENKVTALQTKLANEMAANPPLPGAFTPRKNEYCAAKFCQDNQWYRAKVEKWSGGRGLVQYIDYGNKAEVNSTQVAPLPPGMDPKDERPYAHFFTLACVTLPKDNDYQKEAEAQFRYEVFDKKLLLNVEVQGSPPAVTLSHPPPSNQDIAKTLISEGLLLVEKTKMRKLQKLLSEYMEVQDEAKKKRLNMWEYGDVREDDDKEFGMGRN